MTAVGVVLQAVVIAASATTAAPVGDVVDAPAGGETVIRGSRADGAGTVHSDDVQQGPAALLALPGVALARDGGPLSSARPLRRGLGGARLGVDVAGVGFADPLNGDIDAALLPLGLGSVIVDDGGVAGAPGGQLSIRPAAGHRLQLVVGDLGTLLGSARVVVPVAAGRVVTAVDVGTTRGDFSFVTVDGSGAPGASLRRDGNDQRRAAAVVVADVAGPAPLLLPSSSTAPRLRGHVVAAGSFHEGGVPGFATAPLDLRSETLRGALGGVVGWSEGTRRLEVGVDAIGNRRRTVLAGDADELTGLGAGTTLSGHDVLWRSGDSDIGSHIDSHIDIDVAGRAGLGSIPGHAERREGSGSVDVAAVTHLGSVLVVGASVMGGFGAVVDTNIVSGDVSGSDASVALLPRGELQGHVGDVDGDAVVSLALRHGSRAPTLDERFAPAGFVQGNPDLQPERVTDVEARVVLGASSGVRVDAAAFVSTLEDGIVMVNRNAFEVAPENTGPARRAGVDLGAQVRPHPLVVVEQAASLLWSEVVATHAPLPTAPPLSLRSRGRFGTDDAFAMVTVTGRGSAPSTIFGTLGSGAFVLVDLALRLPLAERLALTVAVDNALDVRTARDQNLLPLPGRLAFVGLEVRP